MILSAVLILYGAVVLFGSVIAMRLNLQIGVHTDWSVSSITPVFIINFVSAYSNCSW